MSRLSLFAALLLVPMGASQLDPVIADDDRGPRANTEKPQREPDALVTPFSVISAALSRETDRVFEPARVKRSTTFKSLIGTRSIGLWNELIHRPGDDLGLPLVGLMCIEQERPELAFDAAVRCIVVSPRPGNPLMEIAEDILRKGAGDRKSTDRIAQILESGAGSDDAISVLLAALTRDDLVACFGALDVDQCAASRLAWVVGAIGEASLDDLGEKTKSKFHAALESLAVVPGISRCTYLSLVDDRAKNLKECLRLAILDPDVKQMYLIPALGRFGKEYSKDISAWLETATEERRAFVVKYISR